MKATKILLSLVMMGTLTLGFAAEDITIDVQIQAIQDATPAERVQLMNQFKIQVSNMNAEDRSAAIAQMQAQMQNHGVSGELSHEQMQGTGVRMQEHAAETQMEHSEEMNRMQNMNQQQAGSQLGHNNNRAGGSNTMGNMPSSGGSSNMGNMP